MLRYEVAADGTAGPGELLVGRIKPDFDPTTADAREAWETMAR